MKTLNKLNIGLVVVTMFGAVSVFAMDVMTDKEKMMMKDKMMDDKMATGTMMKDKMMDKMTDKMEAKMVKKDMMDEKMAMKVSRKSAKAEVMQLQELLISKGLLTVPAGTKLGFYGPKTVAAFAKYKAMMMKEGVMMNDKMTGDKMMKDDKMMGTGTDTMMKK